MVFKLKGTTSLSDGKLATAPPAAPGQAAAPVIVDWGGRAFDAGDVEFAIPDDEDQARAIMAAGFKTHTPLSMHLGGGATDPAQSREG